MQVLLERFSSFFKFKILIIIGLLKSAGCFSQQQPFVKFIWTDNAFITSEKKDLYILSSHAGKKDTIYPVVWRPSMEDTIKFMLKSYRNPVYLELASDTSKKKSNKFTIIPLHTYNLTEYSDSLLVKPRPLVFDHIDQKAQLLYAFLIKLLTELLIAVPVAALFRLPARLLFFVFVANIMSFPITYVTFLQPYLKEAITVALEALFIFLIGWKRLKFHKALIVSVILNLVRFGIFKVVMLVMKIL